MELHFEFCDILKLENDETNRIIPEGNKLLVELLIRTILPIVLRTTGVTTAPKKVSISCYASSFQKTIDKTIGPVVLPVVI